MAETLIEQWGAEFLITLTAQEELGAVCDRLRELIQPHLLPDLIIDVRCQQDGTFLTFTFEGVLSGNLAKSLSDIPSAYEKHLDSYLSWSERGWNSCW